MSCPSPQWECLFSKCAVTTKGRSASAALMMARLTRLRDSEFLPHPDLGSAANHLGAGAHRTADVGRVTVIETEVQLRVGLPTDEAFVCRRDRHWHAYCRKDGAVGHHIAVGEQP